MEKLNVRFSDETKREIQDKADLLNKPFSEIARFALAQGLHFMDVKMLKEHVDSKTHA